MMQRCYSSFLFLSFLLLLQFAHAQYTLPYNYNVSSADGYFLSWGFSEDNTMITVQVVLYQESWVGIMFHNGTDTGMTNGDIVVASFGSNGELVSVDDRWSLTTGFPSLDNATDGCVDNLISRSASQIKFQDTVQTVLTFQRLLNTGDLCDVEIVNDTMNFSFAWGQGTAPSSNTLGNHGPNKGMFQLNLFTYGTADANSTYVPPPSTSKYTWQGLHGTLMIFSFAFLMTLGTFLPRYLKEFWWWFPLHIIIQVSAVVLSLVGFGIALVSVTSQFSSYHTYFGATTLILAFISPFIGTASHFMWKPSRDRIPIFPDVLHWWIGRGTLVLSYITILMGMYKITAPIEFVVGFILVLLSYAFIFGFLDVIKIREVGVTQFFSLRTSQHATIQDEYKTAY